MLSFIKLLFKSIFVILLFENCVGLKSNINLLNITELSAYLQHFSNEFFFNKITELTIVQSVRHKRAKYYLNELISEYSRALNHTKIMLKDVQDKYKHSFAYFNLIFIDSYESFRQIDPGPITATEDFSEYYIIVYYSSNENPEFEIQQIFDYCWQYYTVNVSLLLIIQEEAKPILLYTYYPFTHDICQKAQLHVINQNKSILTLKASELFPNKFKDFHNCSLTAALWNVPPYLILPVAGSISKNMAGIEGFILNILSKALNFRIEYVTPPNNEQRGLVKADGSLTGAIKMLNERVADLSLGSFRCTLERSTVLSPSITFYQTQQVFTVLALQQPWTSLEIISNPFQLHIWIVLLALMLLVLSSTYILQFYCPNILNFIYGFRSGHFINTNIIAITLNQAVLSLPQRNFARHIFLLWILLTMILRSIYQGALYDFLKSQQNLAPPNTVAQLIEQDFSLIINVATNDSYSGAPIVRDKLIAVLIMNITDDGGFRLLEDHPDKRYVTGTPKDFLAYYVNTHNKYGVFHNLKETIFTQQLCIYFSKHSYLVSTFDFILGNLESHGLIGYWSSQLLDNRFLEQMTEATIEAPLTLSQLFGIVVISFYIYLLAFIIFVCEIFWFKLKQTNI